MAGDETAAHMHIKRQSPARRWSSLGIALALIAAALPLGGSSDSPGQEPQRQPSAQEWVNNRLYVDGITGQLNAWDNVSAPLTDVVVRELAPGQGPLLLVGPSGEDLGSGLYADSNGTVVFSSLPIGGGLYFLQLGAPLRVEPAPPATVATFSTLGILPAAPTSLIPDFQAGAQPPATSTTSSTSSLLCGRTLEEFLDDLDAYDYVFAVEPGFDPATHYNLPLGSTFSTWAIEDYLCLFPENAAADAATVVPKGYLLDPSVAANFTNFLDPSGSYLLSDLTGLGMPVNGLGIPVGVGGIGGPSPPSPWIPGLPLPGVPIGAVCEFLEQFRVELLEHNIPEDNIPAEYLALFKSCQTTGSSGVTGTSSSQSSSDPPLGLGLDGLTTTGASSFTDGFDGGLAPGWSLGGLWHVSSCQSFMPAYSLGFNKNGCPTNFDTGYTVSGAALTPLISIPSGATDIKISWRSWHDTEYGTYYDLKKVLINTNSGSGTWSDLWVEDGPQRTWNLRTMTPANLAGKTIQLAFAFNSQDSLYNSGQGWYVDSVEVTYTSSSSPPPPPSTGGSGTFFAQSFDGGSAPGWSFSGLWNLHSCKSYSPSLSIRYAQAYCPSSFNAGTTSGYATSPSFSVPVGTSGLLLSWNSWHETEYGTYYDRKTVEISSNGGASWKQLWQEDGSQRMWVTRSIDISPYASSDMRVRFKFDTVDSLYNDGQGWYIDDVKTSTNSPSGSVSSGHSTSSCAGSTYSWPTGTPGMCTNVRKSNWGYIDLTSLSDKYFNSAQAAEGGCNFSAMDAAAQALEYVGGVTVWTSCAFSKNWNPNAGAGTTTCYTASGVWSQNDAGGYTEDYVTLTNRAFKFAKTSGFISHPNQAFVAWFQRSNHAGVACGDPWGGSMASVTQTYCNCKAFPKASLALHEVAHLLAAHHVPVDDDWKKSVCATWHQHDWNYGHWHEYVGVMNYCQMHNGIMNFDGENKQIVYYNMNDDKT